MVQVTKVEWDAEVNRLFVNNTSGDIEADEVKTVLNNLGDSITFQTPTQPPAIISFLIADQPIDVDPDTEISGQKSFVYTVSNSDDVTGNLTLTQDAVTLSTIIDPKGNAENITVTTVTLAAGQSTVFTLSGVDINTNPFNSTFTITARTIDELIYYGSQASNDATVFDFANETNTAFISGSQSISIPPFAGNEYFVIAQLATEPDFTGITIDGVNQADAFIKTPDAFQVNAKNYNAWVSRNQLQGSLVSNSPILLER